MGLVSPSQLTTFLSALPTESTPSIVIPVSASNGMSNMSLNEKQQDHTGFYAPPPQSSTPNPAASPPPMYGSAAQPQDSTVYLAQATSLYAYNPTDHGDLTLQAGDRVSIMEYMNDEWWKGKSERTGEIGIFPRSYVQVNEGAVKRENMAAPQQQQQQQPFMYGGGGQQQQSQTPMSYGNMPMAVSQNQQGPMGNGKAQEMVCFLFWSMPCAAVLTDYFRARSLAPSWVMQQSLVLVLRLVSRLLFTSNITMLMIIAGGSIVNSIF
jgi:hypothetical protein